MLMLQWMPCHVSMIPTIVHWQLIHCGKLVLVYFIQNMIYCITCQYQHFSLYFLGIIYQEHLLDQELQQYHSQALATSTRTTYLSQIMAYLCFCTFFHYVPFPASTIMLCRYATLLARTLNPTIISPHHNAVQLLHLEHTLPNPLKECWLLQTVLKGVKRVKSVLPN